MLVYTYTESNKFFLDISNKRWELLSFKYSYLLLLATFYFYFPYNCYFPEQKMEEEFTVMRDSVYKFCNTNSRILISTPSEFFTFKLLISFPCWEEWFYFVRNRRKDVSIYCPKWEMILDRKKWNFISIFYVIF